MCVPVYTHLPMYDMCLQIVDKHGYKAPFLYHATMVLAKGLSLNLELLISVKLSCVEKPLVSGGTHPRGDLGLQIPTMAAFCGY